MSDGVKPPTAADSQVDLSGRQLGDYRLLRRLGRGAMADVYLAEQSSLHRQVAFKVLKPELTGDPTYIERFQLEARSAAALIHGKQRAAQNNHDAVEKAFDDLLQRLDEKRDA